jgi:GABA permease
MDWKTNVLVIANRTVDSPELLEALRARAERSPAAFVLLLPRNGTDRLGAELALEASLDRIREAGLSVDGLLGDSDPLVAVQEAWDPSRFDEVIVSTLPTHSSRWLLIDLPHRVAKITGASVTHVVAAPRALAVG